MKIANYNEHNFIVQDDDIWATQGQLGKLYGVAEHTVNYHLKNIFESNELDKNSVYREIRYTATDGKNYNAKHYNLDVIIAVGYRINSKPHLGAFLCLSFILSAKCVKSFFY